MGVLLNYPLFHADDDNGAPLTGGLLYTYIAGSSTAKATYTTRAMSTANANPVVLNSRGEAIIYGAGLYKLILKTSAGVTIWTQDNLEFGSMQGANSFYINSAETDQGIAGTGESLLDILTALGTSEKATVYLPHNGAAAITTYTVSTTYDASTYSNVTFNFENGSVLAVGAGVTLTLPSPANIKAAPNQQIFSDAGAVRFNTAGVIPVGWFGVLTSATPAANTTRLAIAVACAKATAGMTLFHAEAGIYQLELYYPIRQGGVPIAIEDFNDLTVQGTGKYSTTIKTVNPTDGCDVFQFNGVEKVTVRNLAVDSTLPGGATNGSNGFSFTNGARKITIDNCYVNIMPYVTNGSIDGGSAFSIQQTGSLAFGDITVQNCHSDGGAFGIHYVGSGTGASSTSPAYNIKFINNMIKNHYSGIYIETNFAAGAVVALETQSFDIIGNQIIDCQRNMHVLGSTAVNVIGNKFYDTLTVSTDPATSAAWISGDTVLVGWYIGSCHRSNFIGNLMYLAAGTNYVFCKGGWAAAAGTPNDRINVAGNTFHGSITGDGFEWDGGALTGYTENSFFINNSIEGNGGADYDSEFFDSQYGNVVLTHDYVSRLTIVDGHPTALYQQIKLTNSTADSTDKYVGMVSEHYDTDEQEISMISHISTNAVSTLQLGGGSSLYNAAKAIDIYAAADTTTVEGTKVASVDLPTGAAETSLWLYDKDNGALQRVSVGIDDSGGAGYKLLRIAN